jgi:hypothetical protein
VGQTQSSVGTSTASPQVSMPANVKAGDQLVLIGSYGASPVNPTTPAGGWTLAGSKVATAMESYVWTRKATSADEVGGSVTTPIGSAMKSTLTLAAYRGAATTGAIAAIASNTDGGTTQHTTSTVQAPAGGWVIQSWSDKSSGTTLWTPPSAGVTVRGTSYGAGNGRTTSLLADSGGPVSAGTYGAQTATTDATSGRAIEWTIALAPQAAGANADPQAAFTVNCAQRDCTVNGSSSTDDGSIVSYDWDFGDGGTATGPTPPTHPYGADGTFTISLKVTDNLGATNTTSQPVTVSATVPTSNVSFVDQAESSPAAAGTSTSVTVPAGVQVDDQLLLVGDYAITGTTSATPTAPAGWTLVTSQVANGLESYVWTRRAAVGDSGSVVATSTGLSVKSTLTLAAYRGVASSNGIAAFANTVSSGTSHPSPTVTAPANGWLVQVWTDKSSGTTVWTPPAGVTVRGTSYGSANGRTSALLVDSGGPVAAGVQGGGVATTDASSGRAIAWTLALTPSP